MTSYSFKYQSTLSFLPSTLFFAVGLLFYDILFWQATPISRLIPQPNIITTIPVAAVLLCEVLLGITLIFIAKKIMRHSCIYEGYGVLSPDVIEIRLQFSHYQIPLDKIMDVQFSRDRTRWAWPSMTIKTKWRAYRVYWAISDGNLYDERSSLHQFYRAAEAHWKAHKKASM